MVSPSVLSAVVQAIIVSITLAITLIGIALWFGSKVSNISSSLESMDDSIDKVEDEVRDVDLKEIEKTVLRLEYVLDGQSEAGNSVYHTLPMSDIEVTISLAAQPSENIASPAERLEPIEFVKQELEEESIKRIIEDELELEEDEDIHQAIEDDIEPTPEISEDEERDLLATKAADVLSSEESKFQVPADLPEDDITYVKMEFDEKIRSRAVADRLNTDEEIAAREIDLFGYECGFNPLSPLEMEFSVPSTDYDEVTNWIPDVLEKIDEYHCKFEEESDEFDRKLEKKL